MLALGLSSSISFLFTFHHLLYTYKPPIYTYNKPCLRRHIISHHTSAYQPSLTLYITFSRNSRIFNSYLPKLNFWFWAPRTSFPIETATWTFCHRFCSYNDSGFLGWHHEGRLAVDLAAIPRSQIHQPSSLLIRACSRHLSSQPRRRLSRSYQIKRQ